MRRLKLFLCFLILLLFPASLLFAQATTAVTATTITDASGNPLALGRWCFNQACLRVIAGSISGNNLVPQGTGSIQVLDLAGTSILLIPNVTLSTSTFSFDGYTLGASQSASGTGIPLLACSLGAKYTRNYDNSKWMCRTVQGSPQWIADASLNPSKSGSYSGVGAPMFYCTAPCSYTTSDGASAYNLVGNPGDVSNVWVLQSGTGGGYIPPTGTGFPHITSGAADGTARAVNLASSDVTGSLPLSQTSGSLPVSQISGNLPLSQTSGVLPTTQLTGNLPLSLFAGGVNASSATCWYGDATWKTCSTASLPPGTTGQFLFYTGTNTTAAHTLVAADIPPLNYVPAPTDFTKNAAFELPIASGGTDVPPAVPNVGAINVLQYGGGLATQSHSNVIVKVPQTAADVTTLIQAQTGCGTAGYVWSPQSSTCVAQSAGGGNLFLVPRDLRYRMAIADPDANAFDRFGMTMNTSGSVIWDSIGTSTPPDGYVGASLDTTTTALSYVGFYTSHVLKFASNGGMQIVASVPSATNISVWLAATDHPSLSVASHINVGTDLGYSMIGFRHVQGTDTNWACAMNTDTSTTTSLDSGVALDPGVAHQFDVIWTAGAPKFYIDGVQVCSGIATTNKPLLGTDLAMILNLENTTAASQKLRLVKAYLGAN